MMRRLFLVVVASFLLSGTAAVAGVTASPAVAATQTICSNQAVPAGWVVTRVATGGACGTNYMDLRRARRAGGLGDRADRVDQQQLPDQHRVVGRAPDQADLSCVAPGCSGLFGEARWPLGRVAQ